ncbi:MAG: hypothetical protein ACXVA2_22125 [Mucilaginibacter sp.]
MNKKWFLIIAIPLILSCVSAVDDWKELDLGAFKITIPNEWNYQKVQGEDSFVGKFTGSAVSLSFDCSNMGYANGLIPTREEYLKKESWMRECYFCKPGVTYTANFNVKNEKIAQMKKRGIIDSTRVKVEADPSYQIRKKLHKPTSEELKKYAKADYIAELTYRDSTISIPIEIPFAIKMHNIRIDTTDEFIIKTIWPKTAGKGMTGIYIKSRKSSMNFNLVGVDLLQHEQELALQAFKTIKLKDQ